MITNPGGLFGITVDRLGREGTTSARNARLIEICRYARAADGARVVETLASGIPRVLSSLREAELPAPLFYDTGIRFTAVLRTQPPPLAAVPSRNASERAVLSALAAGEARIEELERRTGMKAPTIRKALRALANAGLVVQHGGRGQVTTYRRNDP